MAVLEYNIAIFRIRMETRYQAGRADGGFIWLEFRLKGFLDILTMILI